MNCWRQLVALICFLPAFSQGSHGASPDEVRKNAAMVVETAWLADHMHDPNLIIFHVGGNRREYKNGHIPGARFLWTQALATSNADMTLELPPVAQADTMLNELGVFDNARIVIYFANGNVTPATRVYLTLEYLGFGGRVSLLNGGIDAWKAEGKPVVTETPNVPRGSCTTHPEPGLIVDSDWIVRHMHDSTVTIVDARGAQFYEGHGGGMPRAGHIPGAVNIPFTSLMDSTNKLKSEPLLRELFRAAGVKTGNTIVTYCHIGQQATLVYFTAKMLGYSVRLYDGSFEDWSGREELPVVNPAEASGSKK